MAHQSVQLLSDSLFIWFDLLTHLRHHRWAPASEYRSCSRWAWTNLSEQPWRHIFFFGPSDTGTRNVLLPHSLVAPIVADNNFQDPVSSQSLFQYGPPLLLFWLYSVRSSTIWRHRYHKAKLARRCQVADWRSELLNNYSHLLLYYSVVSAGGVCASCRIGHTAGEEDRSDRIGFVEFSDVGRWQRRPNVAKSFFIIIKQRN